MSRYHHIVRLRTMLFLVTLMYCVALGTSQPVGCNEDGDCSEGSFCETSLYLCHKCLSCQDLKREPLRSPQACIRSIRECGPCLKGLVENRQGELNCVPPTAGVSEGDGSSTAWIIAGITIALVFVVAVAVVFIRYICRNSFIKFNLDTNIDATMQSHHMVASAPESPPPYSPASHQDKDPPRLEERTEETASPLIKTYQPPYPAYESQDYQNVSMFNPPSYVRLNGLQPPNVYNDVNDNFSPAENNEDTTPSPWVPGPSRGETTTSVDAPVTPSTAQPVAAREVGESAGAFTSALATARATDLIQSPPVTLQLQTLNSNAIEDIEDESDARSKRNNGSGASTRPCTSNGNVNVLNVNQIIAIIKPPH